MKKKLQMQFFQNMCKCIIIIRVFSIVKEEEMQYKKRFMKMTTVEIKIDVSEKKNFK